MNSAIFNPIGRVTYLIGVIVLYFSSLAMSFSLSNSSSFRLMLPVVLFLSLARIIWDYKRIIDISKRRLFLLLLIISVITFVLNIFSLLENYKFISFFSGSNVQLSKLIFYYIFVIISFCYQLFLIFKKGNTGAVILPATETQ